MCLQNEIMTRYNYAKGKQKLREISEDTGISISRVFRLINGSKMKLEEYEAFLSAIYIERSLVNDIENLAKKCVDRLELEKLKEIKIYMERKLRVPTRFNLGEN